MPLSASTDSPERGVGETCRDLSFNKILTAVEDQPGVYDSLPLTLDPRRKRRHTFWNFGKIDTAVTKQVRDSYSDMENYVRSRCRKKKSRLESA